MHQLKSLFEPIKVGKLELKNRIVMAAMGLGYCPDGRMTERMINFFSERAKGGVGLIICNLGKVTEKDENIQGLRELADAVHAHGAKIAAQLVARTTWAKHGGSKPELVGPSDFAPPRGGRPALPPRPLTIEEIEQMVEEKGEEARRIREAGFDAIQLHANVGTCLASYFISPLTNRRTDRYGGSLENRYRFLLEILDSTQKQVGKDYPIMCRISGTDFLEGGYTLEDSKMAAPMLEKAGISAISVVTGWHEAPVPSFQMGVPQGNFIYLAEEIKKVVNIPVIGGTKVTDPVFADQLIADGKVDLVYMARPLLADAELPNKAREGRFDEIRTCFACGYCFDARRGDGDDAVYCAINPQAGREAEYTIEPALKPKRVLIVGGGPAGMEAARVAALRGHHVTLLERKDKLGGNLITAAIPPHKKEDIGHLIKYFSRQMELCGVEVKLNQEAAPEFIEQGKPDVVIVATGASALIPEIQGVKGNNVTTALDVLTGARETGERVVIIGGGMIGCETAEFLAEKGKQVTILEMLGRIGGDIGASYRWVVMQRLRGSGIKMETRMKAEEITSKGVKASRDNSSEFFEGDTVVLAVGLKCNDELFHHLQEKVASLYSIGDCVEPHRVAEAVESGYRVAREI
ncbi:FAD-dependent oxidoreductase [Chloroflexota bacterium]